MMTAAATVLALGHEQPLSMQLSLHDGVPPCYYCCCTGSHKTGSHV